MTTQTPLQRAVRLLGGQAPVARICGVKQQNVWHWLNKRNGLVPPQYAVPLERAVEQLGLPEKVTRRELSPDFPWDEVEGVANPHQPTAEMTT